MIEEFLVVFLFAVHVCLFVDMSSLQKKPICKLNFLIGSLIATIPAMVLCYLPVHLSLVNHITMVLIFTFFSSVLITLNIQKYLDYEVDF